MLTHSLRDTSYSPSPSLRSFSSCQRRCEIECWASPCIVVFIFSFPNLHMCIFENFALYKNIDPLMYLSPDLHVLVTKNPEGEEDKEEQDEEEKHGGEKPKASDREVFLGVLPYIILKGDMIWQKKVHQLLLFIHGKENYTELTDNFDGRD